MPIKILSYQVNPLHHNEILNTNYDDISADYYVEILNFNLHDLHSIKAEKLNQSIKNGPEKGVSILWALTLSEKGQCAIENNRSVLGKISVTGFNTPIAHKPDKGSTPLFWLVSTCTGRNLLASNPRLIRKIRPKGLNAVIEDGPYRGQSAFWWLISTAKGIGMLHDNPDLFINIDSKCLNTICEEGLHAGKSVLWWLSIEHSGQKFLHKNPKIIKQITKHGLNNITYDGSSSMFWLTATVLGCNILKKYGLVDLFDSKTLNHRITTGRCTGLSVLFNLSKNSTSRSLLMDTTSISHMIAADTLNASPSFGVYADLSPLILLCGADDGLKILQNNPHLIDKISINGLNRTIKRGQHIGQSALSRLTATDLGLEIISDHPSLIAKISTEGLNTMHSLGSKNNTSSLIFLANNTLGRHILQKNENIIKCISADGLKYAIQNNTSTITGIMGSTASGKKLLRKYTKYHPKKHQMAFIIPKNIEAYLRDAFDIDPITYKIIINPARVENSRSQKIYEYESLYWWLITERKDPCTFEQIPISCNDPDDIVSINSQEHIKMVLRIKKFLQEKINEIFIQTIKLTKNIGIRFFLQFPDVFTHFDLSLLHEQIKKDDFNSVSVHTHLESNAIGKKLCRVIEKCKYVKSTTCSTHV